MDSVRRVIFASIVVAIFGTLLLVFGEARADTIPATPPASSYSATATPDSVVEHLGYSHTPGIACPGPYKDLAAFGACWVAISNSVSSPYNIFHGCNMNAGGASCFLRTAGGAVSGGQNLTVTQACPAGTTNGTAPDTATSWPCLGTLYTCPTGGTLSGTTCNIAGACPAGYTLDAGGATCSAADCGDFQSRNSAGDCACSTESLHNWLGLAPYSLYEAPLAAFPSTLDHICMPTAPGSTSGCKVPARMANSICTSSYCEMQVMHGASGLGQSCTAGAGTNAPEPVNNDSPEHKCISQGLSFGTLSGQVVCVPKASSPEPTKSPTKSGTEVTKNGSGTTTETKETSTSTECANGVCTTTTTVTTRDGSGTVTGTTTTTAVSTGGGGRGGNGDGEGADSGFAASCASQVATIVCDGDAIQCAIAREQHAQNCRLLSDVGGFGTGSAVDAFNEAREFDKAELTEEPVALADITSTTFLAGGALTDVSVTMMGEDIVLPFSELNDVLGYIGTVFLAICGILAYRVVARGVA